MAATKPTKASRQLADLESLAESLGVRVSYEPMTGIVSGRGGLCRVRGELRVIIDRRHKPPERVQLLAEALARFDLGDRELDPELALLLRRPGTAA